MSDDEMENYGREVYEKGKLDPRYLTDPVFRNHIDHIGKGLDNFSSAVAREISHKLSKQALLDKTFKEMGFTYETGKKSVIVVLKVDPTNLDAKRLAKQFISIEKDCGMYNQTSWQEVLKYL